MRVPEFVRNLIPQALVNCLGNTGTVSQVEFGYTGSNQPDIDAYLNLQSMVNRHNGETGARLPDAHSGVYPGFPSLTF